MNTANRTDAVICGIDPGLGTTGYAILRDTPSGAKVVDAGVCRFGRKAPLDRRLLDLKSDISSIFDEHRPVVVAVEELFAHYKHPRTAILMGHARGVILLAAAEVGASVHSYSATRIKRYLTGNGRATKLQMQRAIETTLGLDCCPESPDVADALAIALCCWQEVTQATPTEVIS